MKTLSREIIEEKLQNFSGWSYKEEESEIEKLFEFEGFSDAMVFVNRVAEIAEEENHHPDITISYNKATLRLTTHESGGVTEKDITLAKRVEGIQ